MRYQVHWVSEAEAELAAIWLRAGDRNAVTRAADNIDQMLQANPQEVGESRAEERRILLEPPLGVTFTVSPLDRTVLVLAVWRFESHRNGSSRQESP
jgi:hypothetical protein